MIPSATLAALLLFVPPDVTLREQVWSLIDEHYVDRSFVSRAWAERRPDPKRVLAAGGAADRKDAERLARELRDRYSRVLNVKEAAELSKLESAPNAMKPSAIVEAFTVRSEHGGDHNGRSETGYVRLSSFTAAAPSLVESALRGFEADAERLSGVILDLRGNGGGSLEACLTIAGMLLPDQGPVSRVVQFTSDATGCTPRVADYAHGPLWEGALEVWVDGQTASAAEALAGALRDHGRASLVGMSSTFGKGTVQRIYPLQLAGSGVGGGDGGAVGAGALKLTIATSASPSGASLSKGLTPDRPRLLLSGVFGRNSGWAVRQDVARTRFDAAPLSPRDTAVAPHAMECPAEVLRARDDWHGRDAPLWSGATAPALAALWAGVTLAAVRSGSGGAQRNNP